MSHHDISMLIFHLILNVLIFFIYNSIKYKRKQILLKLKYFYFQPLKKMYYHICGNSVILLLITVNILYYHALNTF